MQIEPLPKKFYDKAVSLGVTEIHLNFSGGSDEGYLNVHLVGKRDYDFASEIENWAWEAYSYSGAGDGNDYGDDIIYDIVNKKASCEEWYMSRTSGGTEQDDLEISEG